MPIVLLTVLGALLRFFMLGHQGFWYDEAYTASVLRLSPGEMLGLLPTQESTPPLYYCVAWVWVHVFGDGTAGLRSLSALCGTLTIPVAYVGARKLLGSARAALIVAALTACNPLLIWYSQEARAYAMLVLLSACSLAAFAYALERPTARRLALWALGSILALTTHYYAALILVPEAVWLLRTHLRRRDVWLTVAAIALAGVALLPLLVAQTHAGNYRWIARIPLSVRLGEILPLALIGPEAPAREILKFVSFGAVLVGVVLLGLRARAPERRGALLTGGIATAGLAMALVGVLVSDTLLARNLLPLWIPAAVVLAGGLGTMRSSVLGPAAAATLCVVGIVAVIGVDTTSGLQRPNWQPVAAALGQAPASGDARLVLLQRMHGPMPLGLYVPGLRRAPKTSLHRVTEIDVVAQHSPIRGRYCWWGAACNLPASRLQRVYAVPGFRVLQPTRRVEQFQVLRLVDSEPVTVTRAMLRDALTNTDLQHDTLLIQR